MDTISLDCSVDAHPVSGVRHNRRSRLNACGALIRGRGENIIFDDIVHDRIIMEFLLNELETMYADKYQNVVKVFVINETSKIASGYALQPLNTTILFKGGFDSDNRNATSHEVMHVLGLYHTFDIESPFVFEKYKTDNITDYSDMASDYNLCKNVYTTSH